MFGICHSESGGGGGEFCAAAVPDEPLVDAFTAAAFAAIVLCSIFWLDADELDCVDCDWEDTPAAAAAAAATANADKSFLFFLLRFRADDVVPIGSTHITCCVWFFCVLLNLQADFSSFFLICNKNHIKKTNERKKNKQNKIFRYKTKMKQ